ncbi:hypothetical protein GO730_31340 [Spirosoma sp. HMF3257]|uniref:hypothetical protein n=1 Tax=Spirosoma telluris TaxID=2183553 RepID=UPI0011B9408D|nr:hypothetical protein [Spirosoma telluris]
MNRFRASFRRSTLALGQTSPLIQDRQKSSQPLALSGQPTLDLNSIGNLPRAQAHPSPQNAHSGFFSQASARLNLSTSPRLKRLANFPTLS